MKNRIKRTAGKEFTREQIEQLVTNIAEAKNAQRMLQAHADASKLAIDDAISGEMAFNEDAIIAQTVVIQNWAEAHPEEFGPGRKSIDFTSGTIGFRTGTPKLKTILKVKWDQVLETLRGLTWGGAYIRVKEEINKEQIIADVTARVLPEADLRKAGAQVVQEETFFVEPKLATVEKRSVTPAK